MQIRVSRQQSRASLGEMTVNMQIRLSRQQSKASLGEMTVNMQIRLSRQQSRVSRLRMEHFIIIMRKLSRSQFPSSKLTIAKVCVTLHN